MIDPSDPSFHVAYLTTSTAITVALTAYAARHRGIQGAIPFAGLVGSFSLYSAFHLVGLLTHDVPRRLLWNDVQWTWTIVMPLCWLLFAMAYTGYDEGLSRRSLAALGVVPALSILLMWTNDRHGLFWSRNEVVIVDGFAIMDQGLGPWFWVYIAYTWGVGIVGSLLLLRLAWLSEDLYTDQSALLVVGVFAPIVASVVTIFELGPNYEPAIDVAPYSFAISGLAFGYAVFRRRLFVLVPATRHLGRNAAIRQLDDGVVIVDGKRRIVYVNPAAGSILGCEPSAALGEAIDGLVADLPVEFDVEDALAEIDRGDRRYEVRTSSIENRRGRTIGHTVVFHDVTERERRKRRLLRQRDELRTVNQLNAVIRGVNQALVSARTRDEIVETVCERLAESSLYATATAADVSTWRGSADRWITRGSARSFDHVGALELFEGGDGGDGNGDEIVARIDAADGDGTWAVVPIAYGRTLHGVLALCTDRDAISDRERDVLLELGELVGHAIDAVENRQLLSAETLSQVDLESGAGETALAAAADDARIVLEGFVPGAGDAPIAYLGIESGSVERVRARLADRSEGDVRTIRAEDGLLEWIVAEDDPLRTIDAAGGHVREAIAEDGRVRYTVDAASEAAVRSLVERVRTSFPRTTLLAKREREGAIEPSNGALDGAVADLTDRQRESLEAAYRAGYFEWPRESTAEEVAESLDVSSPTLHGHLRKAERSIVEGLFERDRE